MAILDLLLVGMENLGSSKELIESSGSSSSEDGIYTMPGCIQEGQMISIHVGKPGFGLSCVDISSVDTKRGRLSVQRKAPRSLPGRHRWVGATQVASRASLRWTKPHCLGSQLLF